MLMWAIVVAGVVPAMYYLPDREIFHRNVYTSSLLLLALVNWLYLFSAAITTNRRAARSAAAVNRLITTGVYAKVRHPIYSADIFLAWGIFFFMPTLKILVSVVWMTVALIAWMKLEEAALEEKFGQDYVDYTAQTPMMIPAYFAKRQSAGNQLGGRASTHQEDRNYEI